MKLTYPRISKDKSNNYFITFYFNNKRYRLYSSKKIGGNTHPNSYEGEEQLKMAYVLAAEVYNHFKNGGKININQNQNLICHKDYLKAALDKKKASNYSKHYTQLLERVYSGITQNLGPQNLSSKGLNNYLARYSNPSSYNTIKKHLNALLEGAYAVGMMPRINYDKKSRKIKAKLHKPFNDLSSILNEIKGFDFNLYLCCLMTYGCLLRPHREIRELKWSDFSDDLGYIHLSGHRNKSAKNRIVPVPIYIRELLVKGQPHHNMFTDTTKPLNEDYFKTLWGRFKRVSKLLEQDQTLYSFRHTGAIEIFKRTGSITKLQKAMGHSSINVSLTYLRGLEIAELKEKDMPMI